MPELPEVETIRRGLIPRVVGQRVVRVTQVHHRVVRGSTPKRFAARVRGAVIHALTRYGKYLLFQLDNGHVLVAHLRMSGKFAVVSGGESLPYTRARFEFQGKTVLCFLDVRTLGTLHVTPVTHLSQDPSLRLLGPDALAPSLTFDHLWHRCRGSRRQLKVFLLDQSNLAGLGNIYASEVCFRAKLSPFRRVNRLTRAEVSRLHRAVRQELTAAIDHGGTSFDVNSPHVYLDADGNPGTHGDRLHVYRRAGLPCRVCGKPVHRKVQQGRATYYCRHCQR